MGTAIVACKIPGQTKSYDLVVSTYQMCILFLFNYHKVLTLSEIADHMGFDEATCKKNVHSLTAAKPRILVAQQQEGSKDLTLKINESFQSQLKRITFPVPVLEAVVKKEKIVQDRSHAVDAALVRIMKSRKRMQVNDLRIEVVTLMQNFKPDIVLINKRLENLIEREYMERDKNDDKWLIYKA